MQSTAVIFSNRMIIIDFPIYTPQRLRYDAPRCHNSSVVQSVERRTVNPYVTGSSPVRGAKFREARLRKLKRAFLLCSHCLAPRLSLADRPSDMQKYYADCCPIQQTHSLTHFLLYSMSTLRYDAPRCHNSSVVQSVERRTVNPYVTGSSPVRGAKFRRARLRKRRRAFCCLAIEASSLRCVSAREAWH